MSLAREEYKLLWPLTEPQYQGLLDEVYFKDEPIPGSTDGHARVILPDETLVIPKDNARIFPEQLYNAGTLQVDYEPPLELAGGIIIPRYGVAYVRLALYNYGLIKNNGLIKIM